MAVGWAAHRKGDQRSSGRAIERRVEGKAIRQLAEVQGFLVTFEPSKVTRRACPTTGGSADEDGKAVGGKKKTLYIPTRPFRLAATTPISISVRRETRTHKDISMPHTSIR